MRRGVLPIDLYLYRTFGEKHETKMNAIRQDRELRDSERKSRVAELEADKALMSSMREEIRRIELQLNAGEI